MATLRDLFIGDPKWGRPTPGANRCVVQAGTACCICVPNTATRVVVEMWGQGGGGAGGRCCSWGCTGGQGGSYARKVWSGSTAPACTGQAMCFCGCVCACDCKVPIGDGHPGQFSRLTNCNTLGGAGIGSWVGCVNGGCGGTQGGIGTSWPCCGAAGDCNRRFDTCCIVAGAQTNFGYYTICGFSEAQSSACDGGSLVCCAGASCYCATGYCSATCTGTQHRTCELTACLPASSTCGFDGVFAPVSCACFDVYRLGACGFSIGTNLGYNGTWNYCHIGNGGAAFAGGAQQLRNFSNGNFAYCGFAGNFPGGGGKSSAACGGGCCCGSIGGGGVILVSWDA